MADRNFVLKWAHLGLGRNPLHRKIIEEEQRAFEAHVAEIQAEQEEKNAALAARKTNHTSRGSSSLRSRAPQAQQGGPRQRSDDH